MLKEIHYRPSLLKPFKKNVSSNHFLSEYQSVQVGENVFLVFIPFWAPFLHDTKYAH